MIGAFNPYTAGSSPQQPNISVDTVSKLLGGANRINSYTSVLRVFLGKLDPRSIGVCAVDPL